MLRNLLTLATVTLLPAGVAYAATMTATHDGFVFDDDQGTSRATVQDDGTGPTILVHKNGATSANRYRLSYIKFDISNLGSGITPSMLTEADLKLTRGDTGTNNNGSSFELWGLVNGTAADHATTGWTETTLKWDNAPAKVAATGDGGGYAYTTDSASPTGTPSGYAQLLGSFTWSSTLAQKDTLTLGTHTSSNVTASTNLASDLLAFLKSDTNGAVTFMLRHTGGHASHAPGYYSSENLAGEGGTYEVAYAPTLVVAVPEPAALSLIGLGAVAFLGRRRLS